MTKAAPGSAPAVPGASRCSGEGRTHHYACACREAEWAERFAAMESEIVGYQREIVGLKASLLASESARREAERLLAECDDELENASCPPMTNETIPERIARLAGLVSSTARDEQAALEGKVAAESRLAAAEGALRHAARELQYIADDERCDKLHQSEEGLACIALAEQLLGPMRDWPEEPNASARSYLAGGRP